MLGVEYYREPSNKNISYEIVNDPSRLRLVQIWKNNRPPDMKRVYEVMEHMKDTNICDGQILLAVIDGICVCYDGSHRLEACKQYFPDGGVQVRIIYNSSNDEVSKEFIRINKSIPVPELYFSDDDISIRINRIVQSTIKGILEFYPSFVSTSRRPQKPNYNRDIFTEELSDVIKSTLTSEEIMSMRSEDVSKWLQDTNTNIRVGHYNKAPRLKLSPRILEKCEKQKFYLFAGNWKDIMKSVMK